jgi:hypothetical protein
MTGILYVIPTTSFSKPWNKSVDGVMILFDLGLQS